MADNADVATEIIEEGLERSLHNMRAGRGLGAEDCEDCGTEIPAQRREAVPWAVRCVECQEMEEVRKKARRT